MPVTKSAKKKLRKDINRTLVNSKLEKELRAFIKEAKVKKTASAIAKAVSAADKAAKRKIIHQNKAARIKSSLSSLTAGKKQEKKAEKTSKKASK